MDEDPVAPVNMAKDPVFGLELFRIPGLGLVVALALFASHGDHFLEF
jgi:hypothetical protein